MNFIVFIVTLKLPESIDFYQKVYIFTKKYRFLPESIDFVWEIISKITSLGCDFTVEIYGALLASSFESLCYY